MADFTRLKNYIDSLCDQYPIASSDVIVMREHEQVFRGMNGFRYAEKRIPLDGKELYYIFSCTKMCTCVAAMQLIERGKMNLSDKLADYIPEFAHMKVKLAEYREGHPLLRSFPDGYGNLQKRHLPGSFCPDGGIPSACPDAHPEYLQ